MITFIILLVIAVALVAYTVIKKGDRNNDGKVDINDVKITIDKVVDDLHEGAEDVLEEVSDVISAIQGKPTKAKLNRLTKQELVDSAKADHGVDLDIKVKKSVLVNKVYNIYHK